VGGGRNLRPTQVWKGNCSEKTGDCKGKFGREGVRNSGCLEKGIRGRGRVRRVISQDEPSWYVRLGWEDRRGENLIKEKDELREEL